MKTSNLVLLSLVIVSLAAGCGDVETDAPTNSGPSDSVRVSVDDTKTDSTEVQVDAAGITLWATLDADPANIDGEDLWLVHGRMSVELVEVEAAVADSSLTHITFSGSEFEVGLHPKALVGALDGEPLLITVDANDGGRYTVFMTLRSQIIALDESAGLHVGRAIGVVQVGDHVVFRSHVDTDVAMKSVAGYTSSSDLNPSSRWEDPTKWLLEWPAETFPLAAGEPIKIVAKDHDRQVLKTEAVVMFRLSDLGLTDGDPAEVWPTAPCNEGVKDCLIQTDGGDTEACGAAYQVRACTAQ